MTDRTRPPFQRTVRWLLLAVVFLILYGSLYPFVFDVHQSLPLLQLVKSVRFVRTWRGDTLANVLLYMPLGLCIVAAFARGWPAVIRVTLALLAGGLLSLAVEVLQTMESARVASLSDVVLDVVGTAIGAFSALIYESHGTKFRLPGLFEDRPAPVPLTIILLWLGSRLMPFVPALDWQKIKDSLKPVLLSPEFNLLSVLRNFVGWLVVAYAVRRLWKPSHALIALAVLVAGTQLGRILIIDKALSPSELAGIFCMILLIPVLVFTKPANRVLPLVGAVAAIVVAQGLEPWQFTAVPHHFNWLPFRASLTGSLENNIGVLFEKFFWYGAFVWLLSQKTRALAGSTIAVAVLIAGLEYLQLWLPGRTAEITDPLIVLAAGGLLACVPRERQARAA